MDSPSFHFLHGCFSFSHIYLNSEQRGPDTAWKICLSGIGGVVNRQHWAARFPQDLSDRSSNWSSAKHFDSSSPEDQQASCILLCGLQNPFGRGAEFNSQLKSRNFLCACRNCTLQSLLEKTSESGALIQCVCNASLHDVQQGQTCGMFVSPRQCEPHGSNRFQGKIGRAQDVFQFRF